MNFAFWRRWRRTAVGTGGGAGNNGGAGTHGGAGTGGGAISRTSQAVALTRAHLARPHSPDGDPLAQSRLCEGMRPTPIERLRPMLAARTRVFDEAVLTALAAGSRPVG